MLWASRLAAPSLLLAGALVGGCGGAAAVGGDDPVAVTKAYVQAVSANPDGGKEFLVAEATEKLTGSTPLSRYLASHKGAKWEIATVQFAEADTTQPVATQKACMALGHICIVTVGVTAGSESLYFHVQLENRPGGYENGKWQIIDVEAVNGKPDNLLPSGNEAHQG